MHKATQGVRGLGLLLLWVAIALPVSAQAEQPRFRTKPAIDNAPVVVKHTHHTKSKNGSCEQTASSHAQRGHTH